jgi:DNA-binding phage protein
LLTATPRRRDGKLIPGSLQYYYPLRRALDEGLYKPIQAILLPAPDPSDRARSDTAIATRAAELLATGEHHSSTLLVRGGTVARLHELRAVYESVGVDLSLLYNALSDSRQQEIVTGLGAGTIHAVGIVGMLSEGFDLPSLRLVAYHDKHRSLPPGAVGVLGDLQLGPLSGLAPSWRPARTILLRWDYPWASDLRLVGQGRQVSTIAVGTERRRLQQRYTLGPST